FEKVVKMRQICTQLNFEQKRKCNLTTSKTDNALPIQDNDQHINHKAVLDDYHEMQENISTVKQ
ncbi:19993_t:CDS:1, partial [Funneliformis geosporum]